MERGDGSARRWLGDGAAWRLGREGSRGRGANSWCGRAGGRGDNGGHNGRCCHQRRIVVVPIGKRVERVERLVPFPHSRLADFPRRIRECSHEPSELLHRRPSRHLGTRPRVPKEVIQRIPHLRLLPLSLRNTTRRRLQRVQIARMPLRHRLGLLLHARPRRGLRDRVIGRPLEPTNKATYGRRSRIGRLPGGSRSLLLHLHGVRDARRARRRSGVLPSARAPPRTLCRPARSARCIKIEFVACVTALARARLGLVGIAAPVWRSTAKAGVAVSGRVGAFERLG